MLSDQQETDPRRVVVVGPCASGKSTLVAGLRRHGYDAFVCAQEHSAVRALWRHAAPDVVIALSVDLSTIRRRRGAEWPDAIYRAQLQRLAGAIAVADLLLDSAALDEASVLDSAIRWLQRTAGTLPLPPLNMDAADPALP